MSWERYGSPYDPKHRGKNKVDDRKPNHVLNKESFKEIRRLPEGDADNLRIGRGRVEFSFADRQVRASSPSMPGLHDALQEVFRRRFEAMHEGFKPMEFIATPYVAAEDETSHDYDEAREAVKSWIVEAPDQSFDDIIGNDEVLEQLRDAIEGPFLNKDLYKAYGMKAPKGALLSGPPGCGKTMFARAAASTMRKLAKGKVEFISVAATELQHPHVGVCEHRIKSIFAFAREYSKHHKHPLLVFIDEADALLPDRTSRMRQVHSWEETQVAMFLAQMDGLRESGAFVMLATNRPEAMDQAVLRDGRCDMKITVRRPTMAAVEAIIRRNFEGVLATVNTVDELVFAAVECLSDPNKVIADHGCIFIDHENRQLVPKGHRHFCLEHIVSGAMAASVPARAKRHAFMRDKRTGVVSGVQVEDVVRSVNDLFEENRHLEHGFALAEFKRQFAAEVEAEDRAAKGAK